MQPATHDRVPDLKAIALGLLGGAAGGCLGFYAFFWIASQGFYALVLPPGLLGMGAGLASRQRSVPLAIACGVAGLALGLFTEWRFAPFVADKSFFHFITHLHSLKPITLLMLALGTYLSYRFALGSERRPDGV